MAISHDVQKERIRCALIAEGLAELWEASAKRMRERNQTSFFGFFKSTSVSGERGAVSIETAAHGLRTVAKLIRNGSVPRLRLKG